MRLVHVLPALPTVRLAAIAAGMTLAACSPDKAEAPAPAAAPNQVVAPAPAPAASPVMDAEASVRALYARVLSPDFASTIEPNGARVYTASTWAAIEAANAATPAGEQGPIEAEPLCACQDNGGLTLRSVMMMSQTADTAEAMISLKGADDSNSDLTLKLKRENGVWKVDNVQPDGEPDLLMTLKG